MTNYDIKMVRGDTLSFDLVISDIDVSSIESLVFSVKKRLKDEYYIFQKTLSNGITYLGDGIYRFRIAPEDTQCLAASNYEYDIEIKISSDVYTLIIGKLTLIADVTTK